MANENYPEVGAIWPSKDSKIAGSAYLKLPNGMYINLIPSKNKESGPLFNASMKKADYDALFNGGDSNVPF